MVTFEVDQLASEQSWAAFKSHYQMLAETIGALGLHEPDESGAHSLVGGSGALTLQLIDPRAPGGNPRGHSPDLDVVVPEETFKRLGQEVGFAGGIFAIKKDVYQGVIKNDMVPLRVDVLTSNNPYALRSFIGDEPYTGRPNASIIDLDGLHAVYASVVARLKALTTREKDAKQLIWAQVVASARQHPIIGDRNWEKPVAHAVRRIVSHDYDARSGWQRLTGSRRPYSPWLQQLVDADFNHPAFIDLIDK